MSSQLRVELTEDGSDAERLEEVTQQLRSELLDLDVDDVTTPSAGEAPAGARGLDIMAVGALLVSFQATQEALGSLLTAMRGWLNRGSDPKRTLRVQLGTNVIELSGHPSAVEEQLVAEFLRAVASSKEPSGGE